MISQACGTKLDRARPNQQARNAAVKALALENANRVSPLIMDQINGGKTYRYIADQLNGLSVPTERGGTWYAGTVRNYHKMLQNTQAA